MVVEPSDPREVQRLKEELELLIFELRLVGVPADVVTPIWEAVDGLHS